MSRLFSFSVFIVAMSLAGCEGAQFPGIPTAPTTTLSLVDGSVTAGAPAGYCIETRASRASAGFAVIAPCVNILGPDVVSATPAFVTVQVGPRGSASVAGSEPAFMAFLGSDAGKAVLSGTGNAGSVNVVATNSTRNQVTVIFTDASPSSVAGLQPHEWRAFLDMNGRLVTIALRGPASDPLGRRAGQALLEKFVAAMSAVNGTQTATST